MTREESIRELKIFNGTTRIRLSANFWEALNMAIKALEQEPNDDAVSRQVVFETIDDCNSDGLKGIFCSYDDGERFKEYIKKLPPVTPTHTETVTEFADRCRECGKQKKGKWKRGYSFPDGEYVKCTVCGEIIKCIYPMHYCPNCGAEMESED